MRVAIVGGTGAFGGALARRLHDAGDDVVIGSRDAVRARAAAESLGVRGDESAKAVRGAEIVVLAVKTPAVLPTATELRDALGDTPVLSVASELRFDRGIVVPSSGERSLAERLADVVAGPVVAGLHSLAARRLGGDHAPEEDALVCGDDDDAKAIALQLATRLVTGRVVDAGPLVSARALEQMTAVLLNVNRLYRTDVGVRLVGLP